MHALIFNKKHCLWFKYFCPKNTFILNICHLVPNKLFHMHCLEVCFKNSVFCCKWKFAVELWFKNLHTQRGRQAGRQPVSRDILLVCLCACVISLESFLAILHWLLYYYLCNLFGSASRSSHKKCTSAHRQPRPGQKSSRAASQCIKFQLVLKLTTTTKPCYILLYFKFHYFVFFFAAAAHALLCFLNTQFIYFMQSMSSFLLLFCINVVRADSWQS